MRNLTQFTIENSRFTGLILAALIVGGMLTYFNQPRQEDPEILIRTAQVVTQLPGMAPQRVEQLLSKPIEDIAKQIPEIESIKSVSMTGRSIVIPEVSSRYNDLDPIWTELRNKLETAKLPQDAIGPVVNDDYGRLTVVTLALTGVDFTLAELGDIADDLSDEFSSLPLVARTDLYGVQEERIWIEVDPALAAQLGVTTAEMVRTLNSQNVVLPGGSVVAEGGRFTIEPSGELESLEALRDLQIATERGIIYLRDIASIRRGYVEPPQAPAFFNGDPAIILGISMIAASNVVELGRQVNEKLAAVQPRLPLGAQLEIAIFQPDLVQASVADATNNLLQTMAVVLVVVMLFLGLRTGLIVGAMVPLTIMLTLIGMTIWGIELHRVSIAAIIVALGLLVDNGVVIAEDIRSRLDAGEDKLTAALSTPSALAIPLLTSTLTTVLAFMPLVLISDSTGEFLRSLGQVLAMALLGSWLLSITVTPALCFWFLSDNAATEKVENNSSASSLYQTYGALLGTALRYRVAFVAAALALLVLAAYGFQYVKQRSLGPSERNQFTVYVNLPSEADILATQAAALRVSEFLNNRTLNPEVTEVLTYVGGGGPRFFLALSPNDPQPNKAFMVVNTQTPDQIQTVMRRVDQFMVTDVPEASGWADQLFLGPAPLGTVELMVKGPEADELRRIAHQIELAFRTQPQTSALRNDWENPVVKITVNVDQTRARIAGVSSEDIARTMNSYLEGENVSQYRESDKTIPIVIRADDSKQLSLESLRTMEVFSTTNGTPVPLMQVADFSGELEQSVVRRHNQARAVRVAARHPGLTATEFYALVAPEIEQIELPRGYSLHLEGEIKGAQDSNAALFEYAPHALLGILALLVLQFNSLRRPAIILLTIPLVLIGANTGLLLFDGYFDFTAMLGLFSLAGIIINNGIVLIDRIDQERTTQSDINAAIISAAQARARPIIMTTITTVVGLLPLALFGGEFWYGMAIVIMSGLTVGSLLTLGVVPVLYSLMFRAASA